jgi:hypothetical protein
MKHLLLNLTNPVLDSLTMSNVNQINDTEHQGYYLDKSSKEHYRLLSYLSNNTNNSTLIDVGTFKGCSAIALASNKTNTVYSFNVVNQLDLSEEQVNIKFIIDDITNGKYDILLQKAEIILLDTFHDGIFEQKFLDYLIRLNYNKLLLLDDIYLNYNMIQFWNSITYEKYDITQLGHSTGTGAVFCNQI